MPIRVVVADDFPLMRAAVVEGLQTAGEIEIVGEAADGEEALRHTRELRPDVLVLDLRMPGLDGVGVLTRVRDELPDVRVLVMSAAEKGESVSEALQAGAAGYLTKRSSVSELCDAVKTVHRGEAAIEPSLTAHLLRAFAGAGARSRTTLGERELAVLRLVANGLTDDEIGGRLFISARTVQAHLSRVRDKVGVRRRSQLARWATENGLL
jgi:DNA-binding NarL/FixJ family response regulator